MASFKFSDAANRAGAPPKASTIAAWDGSYDAQLLFLMEFDGDWVKGKVDGHDTSVPTFYFSKGRFFHVDGSDPKLFLAKVAKALGATGPKMSLDRAEDLPFEFALLGVDLSRDPSGGFSFEPEGAWTAMKLFLANGHAEVYFNYDIDSGDAEFRPKDEAFGNLVVEELSKVLW